MASDAVSVAKKYRSASTANEIRKRTRPLAGYLIASGLCTAQVFDILELYWLPRCDGVVGLADIEDVIWESLEDYVTGKESFEVIT